MKTVKHKSLSAKILLTRVTPILLLIVGAFSAGAAKPTPPGPPNFGPNVTIIPAGTSEATIEALLTNLAGGAAYNTNPNADQFGTNRSAVLFMPGTYSVQAPIGYYTSIAGLGQNPGDVVINGFISPEFGPWTTFCTENCPQVSITDYFWRSMENLTINAVTDSAQDGPTDTLQWGVSQGAPLRRMQINGGLELVNSFCGNASGGFISDTVVTGNVNPCSQQQWYTRNSAFGSWSGGVWNMVFSGVTGAPVQSYPTPPETVLATTPVSREKPFLYVDDNGNFNVFSPAVERDSTGTTWASGSTPGRSIPIGNFFIAQPSTSVTAINQALSLGKNLILTPGVYQLSQPIRVKFADTIVLGLGYATLVPQTGQEAITVADVGGVQIAGLIVDAGPVNSPVLLKMGNGPSGMALPAQGQTSHASDPSSLSDVFFRIGGATAGSATTSLEVDSADVILDDIWAWRADHGNGVGWTANTASHGLVVNGDRVTALGLAVEHYQQEQVLWNGNEGQTIFYQSELPYDPPSQSAWMDGAANGYPSYVVANSVATHQAWGLGIYSYFDLGINIVEDNAMTVPDGSGIAIHDAGTVWLSGSGSITHVIDGTGAAVNSSYADQLSPVVLYP